MAGRVRQYEIGGLNQGIVLFGVESLRGNLAFVFPKKKAKELFGTRRSVGSCL
jgi:hypothetical protein